MIDRLASMGFYADPKLITLLQESAPWCGGALMSAKQAACDVAAMFGVTPRQKSQNFHRTPVLRTRIAIASAKLGAWTRNKIEMKGTKQGYLLIPISMPSGAVRRSEMYLGAVSHGKDVSTTLFWPRPFIMAPKHIVVSMPKLSYFSLSVTSVQEGGTVPTEGSISHRYRSQYTLLPSPPAHTLISQPRKTHPLS